MADTIKHHISDSQLLDGVATISVMQEVINERVRQDDKWGQQNHPDSTGGPPSEIMADEYRSRAAEAAASGALTWRHILLEEVYEAIAESDPTALREELIQVAAVAAAWAEAIDRRGQAA